MSDSRLEVVSLLALRSRLGCNRRVAAALETHAGVCAAASALLDPGAVAAAAADLARVEAAGVQALTLDDPRYPAALRSIDDAPLLLFVDGRLCPEDDGAVAIVGSRRASGEGRRIARTIAESLAGIGVTVASGLARGVDGEAHLGALAGGGRTLAVLGSGIDRIYPPQHRSLARAVAASGALISELPPGARPEKHHFPMRNRILAGLAAVVVVVEAAERSGSLITARLAADAHRTVLAVPGSPLDPGHVGTNRIIQEFAGLLQGIQDLVDHLPAAVRARAQTVIRTEAAAGVMPSAPLSDKQERVLAVISTRDPLPADTIAERAAVAVGDALSALVELELSARIERQPGGLYRRSGGTGAFQAPHRPGQDSFRFPMLSSQS